VHTHTHTHTHIHIYVYYSSHYISIYIYIYCDSYVYAHNNAVFFTLSIYNYLGNYVNLPQANVWAILITDDRTYILNLTVSICSAISLPNTRHLPHILVRVFPENFGTDIGSSRCVERSPLFKSLCPIVLSSEMRNFCITMSSTE